MTTSSLDYYTKVYKLFSEAGLFSFESASDPRLIRFADTVNFGAFKEADFDESDMIRWLTDEGKGSLETKGYFIWRLVFDRMREEHIAKTGWSVTVVGADENGSGYCYTTGLHDKVGFEIILPFQYHELINHIAKKLVDKDFTHDVIYQLTEFKIKGEGTRVIVRKCSNEEVNKYLVIKSDESIESYIIDAGDENNKLPGEDGYISYYK